MMNVPSSAVVASGGRPTNGLAAEPCSKTPATGFPSLSKTLPRIENGRSSVGWASEAIAENKTTIGSNNFMIYFIGIDVCSNLVGAPFLHVQSPVAVL
jgi:hypothetical protein